jgi:hypothetical protein
MFSVNTMANSWTEFRCDAISPVYRPHHFRLQNFGTWHTRILKKLMTTKPYEGRTWQDEMLKDTHSMHMNQVLEPPILLVIGIVIVVSCNWRQLQSITDLSQANSVTWRRKKYCRMRFEFLQATTWWLLVKILTPCRLVDAITLRDYKFHRK